MIFPLYCLAPNYWLKFGRFLAIFAKKEAKKRPKSGQKIAEKFGATQYPDFTPFWNAKKHRTQFRQIDRTNTLLRDIPWRTIFCTYFDE